MRIRKPIVGLEFLTALLTPSQISASVVTRKFRVRTDSGDGRQTLLSHGILGAKRRNSGAIATTSNDAVGVAAPLKCNDPFGHRTNLGGKMISKLCFSRLERTALNIKADVPGAGEPARRTRRRLLSSRRRDRCVRQAFLMFLVYAGAAAAQEGPTAADWIQLFNGRDLAGWDIKFSGHELNENLNETFRVEDGLLKVRYDQWTGFDGEFGHIFYNQPFSHYVVAVEYRFVGDQVAGGPDWARRNNGIMVHSQSAASMSVEQDFPISIEVQLLGGLGEGPRSTANLCTPGTNVVMDGELFTPHCVNSNSETYDGDQWVRAEALVLGDSIVKHIVNGDTVLTYTKPQMGGDGASNTNPGVLEEGQLLSEGYIALQAETAPIDIRKVEVLNLVGCTDPDASNYRNYYVEPDPDACEFAARPDPPTARSR